MPTRAAKGSPPSRRWLLVEVPAAYALSVLATIGFYQLSLASDFFHQYLHTLVGAMFVAIPMALLLLRHESFDDYGLPPQPILREVLFALVVAALIFPPFLLAFLVWWGFDRDFTFVLPAGFWNAALANLVIVALPEEVFYRGYLMGRLDLLLKGRVTILGAPVGWPVVLAAAMFSVGHYVVTFDPQRLAVFFPALVFGWIRARRGSITAAIVFHALCNIYMDFLLLGFGIVRPGEYYR